MTLTDVDEIELESHLLGAMPIVNHFLRRLGLDEALEHAVPNDDARLLLAPAKVLGVVVRNLVVHHGPIYVMGEWAASYDANLLGLSEGEVAGLNDDRVGRISATVRRRPGQPLDGCGAGHGAHVRH